MINNLIPSRNDILSLQTESYESIQNYNTNNLIILSDNKSSTSSKSTNSIN